MKAILILFFSVMLFGFTTESNSAKKGFKYAIEYSGGNNQAMHKGDYISKMKDMIAVQTYSNKKYYHLEDKGKGEKVTELRNYDVKEGMLYKTFDGHYLYILELNKPVTVDGKQYDMMYVRDYGMGTSSYYIK